MESTIKWHTRKANKQGRYLITTKTGVIVYAILKSRYDGSLQWYYCNEEEILAWCKLSDIEPYKEEKK